jgi:eukaryotic-like serine/threonine-protein kinase
MHSERWFLASNDSLLLSHVQVLQALQHLHNMGVVHRDVKPTNIIRSSLQDRWKFIDFDRSSKANSRASDGAPMTLPYAAPEVACSAADALPQRASDMFSFGIIMWEMLTGEGEEG